MRKCRANEVPVRIIALAEKCIEGVWFNWEQSLYKEFLTKCREA